MILRLWRGWTAPEQADRYEEPIHSAIFPGIIAKNIGGLEGIELHRRDGGDETESTTLMRFSSLAAVKTFAGPDWGVSVVPAAAVRSSRASTMRRSLRDPRHPIEGSEIQSGGRRGRRLGATEIRRFDRFREIIPLLLRKIPLFRA
jgi:hypothetical protein